MDKICENCKSKVKYYETTCPNCNALLILSKGVIGNKTDDEIIDKRKEQVKYYFIIMIIAILLSGVSIGVYDLTYAGKIQETSLTNLIKNNSFTPIFVGIVTCIIITKIIENKTQTKVTEGRIIDYKIERNYFSNHENRRGYTITPIAEYEIDGKKYNAVTKIGRYTLKSELNKNILKNEKVKITYNPSNPSESTIKYNLMQLIELHKSLALSLLAIIIILLIIAII